MRTRARTDGNHSAVVKALNSAGMKAVSTASMGKGFPDLVVGFRDLTMLLEVKDGSKSPSDRILTADERDWRAAWPGHYDVVQSPEEAIDAVIRHAQMMGRL